MAEESKKLFTTGWVAGPSAVLEFFLPPAQEDQDFYQLKYVPPFHSIIRPPVQKTVVGPKQLSGLSERIDSLVEVMGGRSPALHPGGNVAGVLPDAIQNQMKSIGRQITSSLFSPQVKNDLKDGDLFLELGIDESMLHLPWELMHDGEDYICLKNACGRFVNSRSPDQTMRQQAQTNPLGTTLDKLCVLIISVPKPLDRPNGTRYDALPEAGAEFDALMTTFTQAGLEPKTLRGKEATFDNVYDALSDTKSQYQIIHYIGHAYFNDKSPFLSSLVLYDQDMTTGQIQGALSDHPPILCFINGCESAKSWDAAEKQNHFDIYGLAKAILNTGAYMIGNRWPVNDITASTFSRLFYSALFIEKKAIGWAIVQARKGCKRDHPNDVFGWASYIYYGDPRVCLCM